MPTKVLAIGISFSMAEPNEALPTSSVAFLEPNKAPAMDARVDGVLAFGKVRSVRPIAFDWDAKSSAVKLVSARRPIRMAGPEL